MKIVVLAALSLFSAPAFATTVHESPILCSSGTSFDLVDSVAIIANDRNGQPEFPDVGRIGPIRVLQTGTATVYEQDVSIFSYRDVYRFDISLMPDANGVYPATVQYGRNHEVVQKSCVYRPSQRIAIAEIHAGTATPEAELKMDAERVCKGDVEALTPPRYVSYDEEIRFAYKPARIPRSAFGRTVKMHASKQIYACK